MENIIRLSISLMLVIQIISTLIYFKPFFEDWITDNRKHRWVNKRDRLILTLSISYIIISLSIINSLAHIKLKWLLYLLIIIMISFTLILLLFQWTKFKVFQKIIYSRKRRKKVKLLSEDFKLKTISEEDLKDLISKSFSDSYSNKFEDFKHIFIDKDNNGKKLNCINVLKSKKIGYSKIFELMNELSEYGILDLHGNNRKQFKEFVVNNFLRGSEKIKEGNLNKSYSVWLKDNR